MIGTFHEGITSPSPILKLDHEIGIQEVDLCVLRGRCGTSSAGVEHRRRVQNIDGGCKTSTAGAEYWAHSSINGGCKGIDSGCGSIDCGCRSIDGGCGSINGNGDMQIKMKDDWRAKSGE